ncbi:DUF3348 family protein [Roseateles violae]|uniref:DUF3348 family protein n=1 Tax=Roseateles violae TaxID=3058042 RepID=A0ABT8DPS2_9BURK|nr:DUF3348 family protein [Pelomonas sp. PFR6]MDN3920349.1 DUF3348 family protein [Pelomonas sp. PFR6]
MQSVAKPSLPHPPEPLTLLLAQWGLAAASPAPATERLGSCLGWADAIGLSKVLAAAPGRAASDSARQEAVQRARAALDRLRAGSADASDHAELAVDSSEPLIEESLPADKLAPYLQHFVLQQRSQASRIPPLRDEIRACMERAGGELAHIAQLDQFFERAMAEPERAALSRLADLLAKRAKQHYIGNPRRWRSQLWSDLQRLLRADLDQRLQPVLGLVEALSTSKSP